MNFHEVANGDRYQLKEEEKNKLTSDQDYRLTQRYRCQYQLTTNLPTDRHLKLMASPHLTFNNNSTSIFLQKTKDGLHTRFEIIFHPDEPGEQRFELVIEKKGRSSAIKLLDRTLVVKKNSVSIHSLVPVALPNRMKLGQQLPLICTFTNQSNQALTGINLEIKLGSV